MMVFTRIVEAGSISAAAMELDISKSVISQQLKTLETQLGAVLLKRTTRQQVLTPVGKEFYLQCLKIDQITQQAWNTVKESQIEPQGPIVISTPHALIDSIVSPAIGAMVNQYSQLIPVIHTSDNRVNLLDKEIDLAIHVGELPSSEYKQRLIGKFRKVLCASPQYIQKTNLNANKLIKDPEHALECNYVANAWENKINTYQLFNPSNNRAIDLTFRANRFNNSVNSVIAMVKQGAGIALIPDFIFRSYQQSGELVNIIPDYQLMSFPIYAVHAYGNQSPLNVRLCIDFIKRQIQKEMIDIDN